MAALYVVERLGPQLLDHIRTVLHAARRAQVLPPHFQRKTTLRKEQTDLLVCTNSQSQRIIRFRKKLCIVIFEILARILESPLQAAAHSNVTRHGLLDWWSSESHVCIITGAEGWRGRGGGRPAQLPRRTAAALPVRRRHSERCCGGGPTRGRRTQAPQPRAALFLGGDAGSAPAAQDQVRSSPLRPRHCVLPGASFPLLGSRHASYFSSAVYTKIRLSWL